MGTGVITTESDEEDSMTSKMKKETVKVTCSYSSIMSEKERAHAIPPHGHFRERYGRDGEALTQRPGLRGRRRNCHSRWTGPWPVLGHDLALLDDIFGVKGARSRMVLLTSDEGALIELQQCENSNSQMTPPQNLRYGHTGIHELGLLVTDIDAWVEKVRAARHKNSDRVRLAVRQHRVLFPLRQPGRQSHPVVGADGCPVLARVSRSGHERYRRRYVVITPACVGFSVYR